MGACQAQGAGGDLSRIVSRPVLDDAPSCLSQALRDRLSSCDMMVTFLRLLKACANQLFPAPAARGAENKRLCGISLSLSKAQLNINGSTFPRVRYHVAQTVQAVIMQ